VSAEIIAQLEDLANSIRGSDYRGTAWELQRISTVIESLKPPPQTADKVLLELAAKAIGLKLRYNYLGGRDANQPWNPLTDDGDRYRLAKELNIRIHFGANYLTCNAGGIARVITWPEHAKDDAYAVVQAAALMGEAMP
jgi:hypothetical protein